jgi:hypothetical protein
MQKDPEDDLYDQFGPDAVKEFTPEERRAMTFLGIIIICALTIFFLTIISILAWPIILAVSWSYLRGITSTLLGRIVAVALFAYLGNLLYKIRSNFQNIYGAAEICIGIISCWSALSNPKSEALAVSLALAGGVYLIVRGIDNYKQGSTLKPTG